MMLDSKEMYEYRRPEDEEGGPTYPNVDPPFDEIDSPSGRFNRRSRRCRCRGDSEQPCFPCQAIMDDVESEEAIADALWEREASELDEYSEDGRERFLESNDD